MKVILLLAVVLSNTVQNICAKQYKGGVFTFNLVTVLMALGIFALGSEELLLQRTILWYALLFAITYSAAVIFITLALQCGPLSLSSLIYSYTLIIPALYGILFLHEPLQFTTIGGLILLVVSLTLSHSHQKAGTNYNLTPISAKWGVYITLAFVGNGICSTVLKVQQIALNGMYQNEFMVLSLILISVMLAVCSLVFERKKFLHSLRNGWYLGIIRGLANGIGNTFVLILNGMVAVSIMYPIISAGGVIASAIIAIVIYKEKLNGTHYAGIILGVGSIVLLNL